MTPRGATRDRILDAAYELFLTEGLAGTTVTEIERRSGLQPGSGSLYRHFRSKDDVLRALITRELEALKASLDAEREELPVLDDQRSQLLLDFGLSLHHIAKAEPLVQMLRQASGAGQVGDAHEVISKVFGLDGSSGGWPVDNRALEGIDPLDVLVVVAALMGFQQLQQLTPGPLLGVDDDTFVTRLVDLILA